jgi:hypothetical protein
MNDFLTGAGHRPFVILKHAHAEHDDTLGVTGREALFRIFSALILLNHSSIRHMLLTSTPSEAD